MKPVQVGHTKKFYMVGVSFKKTDAQLRSKFSVSLSNNNQVYSQVSRCFEHYFVLNTCNRTEVYGFAPCQYVLMAFIRVLSGASEGEIAQHVYVKEGDDAVSHLLTVAAGLDSQIPGDFEVIGQIRKAFQLSKERLRSNGFIERVVNHAIQLSKEIKNTTSFSDGTISVSYAVAREVKRIIDNLGVRKVCIIGMGEIGLNTLKNLKEYAPESELTIVNRDSIKREEIARAYNLKSFSFDQLREAVQECQIVIVATSVAIPILGVDEIAGSYVSHIFDLSMPRNVAPELYQHHRIDVMDVDQISMSVKDTMDKRLAEIPKVKSLVKLKAQEFFDWQERRKLHATTPASYEQIITENHVNFHPESGQQGQQSCFMANACCHGEAGISGPRMHAYSS